MVVEGHTVSHRCSESSSQWEGLWREGRIKIFILLLGLKEPAALAAVDSYNPGDCYSCNPRDRYLTGVTRGLREVEGTSKKERLGEKRTLCSSELAQSIPELEVHREGAKCELSATQYTCV